MTTISNPVVNITKTSPTPKASVADQRVLLVLQQTGTTITSGSLVENIANDNIVANQIGKGSQGYEILQSYKLVNPITKVDAIVLDDNVGAVQAIKTVDFTGSVATAAGTITINIGSRLNHSYSVAVAIGDDATTIGASFLAAIALDDTALVTAVNTTGSVALTINNGGTFGNGVGVEVKDLPAGVVATLVNTTPGATDPVLTGIFDVVGDNRYQTIIWPGNYDTTEVVSFVDSRWDIQNKILDGVAVMGLTDTKVNIETTVDALNSRSLVVHANKKADDLLYKGSDLFELDDVIAAQFGGLRALRLTPDTRLSGIVQARNLDLIGGPNKASLPYFNTAFLNLPIIDTGRGFSNNPDNNEIKDLNDAGAFVLGNNTAKSNIIADTVVTTYKTDTAANPDPTYKFLNAVDITSGFAELQFNSLKIQFPQYRLTDGGVIPGYNMAQPEDIASFLKTVYLRAATGEFLYTRNSQEAIDFYSVNLTLITDLLTGRITITENVPIVSQLRRLDIILAPVFNLS